MRNFPLFICLLWCFSAFGGNDYVFRQLNSSGGLASNNVEYILKDSRGFVWVATHNGLTRFDGTNTLNYRHNEKDSASLLTNYVIGLCEDKKGNIWAATSGGVSMLNPYTHKFTNYIHVNAVKKDSIISDGTKSIGIFKGKIWVGLGYGIAYTDEEKIEFHMVTEPNLHTENRKLRTLPRGIFTSKKQLWISTFKGMFVTEGGQNFYNKNYNPKKWKILEKGYIPGFYNDGDSIIWFGTWKYDGIYKYDIAKNTLDSFPIESNEEHNFLCFGKYKDELFAGTMSSGIIVFNTITHKTYNISADAGNKSALADNNVRQVVCDNEGTCFIANSRGVSYYNPVRNQIKVFLHNPGNKNSIPDDDFTNIIDDKEGNIWFSTMNSGIYMMDRQGVIRYHNDLEGLEGGSGYGSVLEVDGDNLTVGNGMGVWILNRKTNKAGRIPALPKAVGEFLSSTILGYKREKDGSYWFAKPEEGLLNYDPHTIKYTKYTTDDPDHPIPAGYLGGYCTDDNGIIWVSYMDIHILVSINPETNEVKKYPLNFKNGFATGFNAISAIRPWKGGKLMLLSNYKGIYIFDPATGTSSLYDSAGISQNYLASLIEDNSGNLWISTGNGLVRQDPLTGKQTVYNMTDGLPSNEFTENAVFRDETGALFISCDRALLRINPAELKPNPFLPEVQILSYNKSGKKYYLDKAENEIRLSYKDRAISFDFTGINFIDPDKNTYAYLLEGFDKDWSYSGSRSFATYTNLPGGEYYLHVKATNKPDNWNVPEQIIKIHVTGPFWKTWWFSILCLLMVAGLSFLVYYVRLRQILKVQKMRDQISSDLHDEVGSTLSSIAIYSQVANKMVEGRAEDAIPILQSISDSAHIAMENMSDIVWAINPKNDKFANIMQRIQIFANKLFDSQDIRLHLERPEEIMNFKLDMQQRKNLYLIFKEALTNIAKYAGASNCYINIKRNDKMLEIVIKDDGIGLGAKTESLGGNGLLNMKKRATELNGNLQINSKEREGTVLTLRIQA